MGPSDSTVCTSGSFTRFHVRERTRCAQNEMFILTYTLQTQNYTRCPHFEGVRQFNGIIENTDLRYRSICYNKNYQQMRLFVLCLYFLFLVFSLHVSGLHGPIIWSCCFYATIWFMQCFVDRLRASADWFVVVTSVYTEGLVCGGDFGVHRSHHHKQVRWRTQTINKALYEPNGSIKTTACNTPDDGPMKARNM